MLVSKIVPFGQKHSYPIAVSLHLSVQRCSCVSHSFLKISIKQKNIYIVFQIRSRENKTFRQLKKLILTLLG